MIAAQRANEHRVRFANYITQVVTILCEHAIDLGWFNDNPARGIRKLKVPQDRKQEHVPWPDWAVEKFRSEASPKVRLIFEIGVGSVQRPGDWVCFKWGDYDGKNLILSQNKTDKPLILPCTENLRLALSLEKASLGGPPHPARHILTNLDGSPMQYRRMATLMREERSLLGLRAFDQHAFRYRGVMELAWAGCTDDEIASYSGQTTIAMIRKYAGQARQVMRARQAAQKRR